MRNLRKDYKYALVVPTSMGLRLCPPDGQPVGVGDVMNVQATSAETNVASVCSFLGLPVKVLTALVADSPVASYIRRDLMRRGMEVDAKIVPQGGPWGYRHQINIADSGFGGRGPRVLNDRAGEVGRTLTAADFDLETLFGADGVGIVHMSGLIAALSEQTGELCLEIARTARRNGTLVSFDLNYRESFWEGRKEQLSSLFSGIASLSDILVGNEEDFQLALGFDGPEAGGRDLSEKTASFRSMIARVKNVYGNVSCCASTLREVLSTSRHMWGAVLNVDDDWELVEPREIEVLDRIGGGDGFVGGLLYAILTGRTVREQLEFAWASGALAATFLTDYAQPADEEQIWSLWRGNARVKR